MNQNGRVAGQRDGRNDAREEWDSREAGWEVKEERIGVAMRMRELQAMKQGRHK